MREKKRSSVFIHETLKFKLICFIRTVCVCSIRFDRPWPIGVGQNVTSSFPDGAPLASQPDAVQTFSSRAQTHHTQQQENNRENNVQYFICANQLV